jgi:hypothetical protein
MAGYNYDKSGRNPGDIKRRTKTHSRASTSNTGNAVDRMVKAAAPSAKPTPEKGSDIKREDH